MTCKGQRVDSQELKNERAARRLQRIAQQAAAAAANPEALLDIETVSAMVGLRRSSIYRRIAEENTTFPQPIRLSSRCTRFTARSVQDWLRAQAVQ
jgi:prophage regulatory protein